MPEAVVKLSLTPAEFDLIREELKARKDASMGFVQHGSGSPSERAIERERAARIGLFLDRL